MPPIITALRKILARLQSDFNLNTEKSHYFYKSEWELIEATSDNYIPGKEETTQNVSSSETVSLKYLVYRGAYMLFLNSSILGSTLCQSYLFHIFLTNWSFALQNIYGILSFLSVLWRYLTINKNIKTPSLSKLRRKKSKTLDGNLNSLQPETGDKDKTTREQLVNDDIESGVKQSDQVAVDVVGRNISNADHQSDSSDSSQITILEKTIWILINAVQVIPYCVVLGYWCFVYKPDPDQLPCEKFRSHYIVHGAAAVLALLDTLIIAIPARFFHFLVSTALLFVYIVFTGFYELGGGPYRNGKDHIYSILDWKNSPKKASIVGAIAVLASPLAHTLFCFGMYKLRLFLVYLYKRVSSSSTNK